MSTHDQDQHDKLKLLESIEAKLDQHRRTTKFVLTGISFLGIAILALLLFQTFRP